MSYMTTVRALSSPRPFAGRDWFYDFRELPAAFGAARCTTASNRLLQRYAALTKTWNKEINTEWTCRLFMASKLIMNATLHINSEAYAGEHNLRVVTPYLRYYAALSLARSIAYTLPDLSWGGGDLIRISHTAAITSVYEHLRKLDQTRAEQINAKLLELKAERELISYRAPSSGDSHVSETSDFIEMCTLLAEVAQFNSELFEASLLKNADPSTLLLDLPQLESLAAIEIDGHQFWDGEDAYRLGYLYRKHSRPANLLHLMTEGHVEDYFGAWHSGNDRSDVFNPDDGWQTIFDIP